MEAAIGAASGLISSVVKQLSDELVEAYVASAQLGLDSTKIKDYLMYTQGLLHEGEHRGVSDNPGLQGLLQRLTTKADEAEDALDELHYFIIQDQLDGTQYAVPDLGDGLRGRARHGRHALRHIVGNCLNCFSCSPMQDEDRAAVTNNPHNTTKPDSGGNDGPVDKLPFDRVAMSKKIKSVIEEIHSLCERVSKLLDIIPHHTSSTTVTLNRPLIGSTIVQDKLYGRRVIFEQTIKDITSGIYHGETLSVLPIVGPGGIGKTTFAQHLYHDPKIEGHFTVRVWVCVSTDFDVLRITKQIHDRILALGKEESCIAYQTTDLDQLQLSIAEKLKSSKRFLIVFDDIWECTSESWKRLLAPFMKGEAKGNMVLVTTRFPSKADIVKTADSIALKGLEPDDFFKFFEECIFGGNKPEDYQDDLTDVARNIARKLKGSPLAAKTVGRLLKKKLSREHWMGVLENSEWQKQRTGDDIMPSLRISYDYLPFHLRKCFSYFALFPEDHRFYNLEIMYFWIAIGIIDKDENYMEELVDNGFLMKEGDNLNQYYVLHDLMHELSRSVSSHECLNIYSSLIFRADAIPTSIRHLSITMEDRYDENFREEMIKLRSRIDIVNLRALMIFRKYEKTIDEILEDTFKQIEGLRVLFIVVESPESLPRNFSKLIHLRYLRIATPDNSLEMTLPCTLSRFYHLKLLDLTDWHGSDKLPKDISRLISLRHFLASSELHSNVPEVGRMKCLQELKKFEVKKESVGFELSELGKLTDLGGNLGIYNLEKVSTKKEAIEAKLVSKKDLKKLKLVWGTNQHTIESDVFDGLEPHPNLQALDIVNHGGTAGPSWLCGDIRLKMLQSVYLDGVSWVTLPPLGQLLHLTSLTLKNIYGVRRICPCFGGATEKSFTQLKQIILDSLPELVEWVGTPNAHSFSRLENISCKNCPNLCELPFLECSGSYTHLWKLVVEDCPKLSMPPMPHTSTLTSVEVSYAGANMTYSSNQLSLSGYSGALAFHNMDKLERISSEGESNIPWTELEKLTSLKELEIYEDPSMQSMAPLSSLTSLTTLVLIDCGNLRVDGFNPLITAVNLKDLGVWNSNEDGNRSVAADLLSEMAISADTSAAASSFQLKSLEVDSISAVLVAPICTLLAPTLEELWFRNDGQVESLREEEEKALQLLTSLQILAFSECRGLPSFPQGLHSLPSLRDLWVWNCPGIRSLPKGGLPTSLRSLDVGGCNPELKEQVDKLKGTNPDLWVIN